MSKLSKFIHNPKLFLVDALQKNILILTRVVDDGVDHAKRNLPLANEMLKDVHMHKIGQKLAEVSIARLSGKKISVAQMGGLPKTYLFGFSPWKQFMTAWFPDRDMIFIDKNITPEAFKSEWEKRILNSVDAQIMIWGFKSPKFLQRFVHEHHIPLLYIEDGFIRSVNLGATKTPPFSLSIDSRTPYFNAREASDLEVLLSSYDFASNPALIKRAEDMMQLLLDTGISKYNQSNAVDIATVYGIKDQRRILVIGQVEDDASIEYGCDRRYSNNDLVMMARLENPDAQIIYKPHPDVLHGKRPMQSNPDDVRHVCQVLDQDIPMAQSFETIDHVYTITSQAGFEALQRGITVTTVGCPFYSGWGLTDDRQPNARRTRKLSVAEVFAGAYLLYMRYFDPIYKVEITAEEAVKQLVKLRDLGQDATTPQQLEAKISTYLFGFSPWKQFMTAWFPDRDMIFIDKNITPETFKSEWEKRILNGVDAQIMIWGFKSPKFLQRFVHEHHIPLLYIEDGFIRSVNLGATRTPPFSLSIDSRTPYFNAREASDLEVLLSSYDFASNPALIKRAEDMMQLLLDTGISKYNQSNAVDIATVYGIKDQRRILVIGQVEDDASIEYGCDRRYSNNDLVMMARLENPDAQIIYKPHPDVLHGKRPMQSNPDDVRHVCQVLDQDIPMAQSFETIDHVYTITSQAGFEALQRGITVTTVGCPFYSGWGLTDDRQPNARRTRKLSVAEVFAGAYLLYMRYFDPIYKVEITAEEAVKQLVKLREMESKPEASTTVVPKRLMWMLGFDSSELHRHLVAAYPEHQLNFVSAEELTSDLCLNQIKSSASAADVVLNATAPMFGYKMLLDEWKIKPQHFAMAPLSTWLSSPRYYGFVIDPLEYYASSEQPTALESMLLNNDFAAQQDVIDTWYMQYMQYLTIVHADIIKDDSPKNRVMVLAQSLTDPDMKAGNVLGYNTLDVLALAREEQPNAELICYNTSADLEYAKELPLSLKRAKSLGKITYIDASKTDLQAALRGIDLVYVVTADAGLLARSCGIKVITLGTPFYAGWGLTEDRVFLARRQRPLTLQQLLWAVLHVYSRYIDTIYKRVVPVIDVIATTKQ